MRNLNILTGIEKYNETYSMVKEYCNCNFPGLEKNTMIFKYS